MNRSKSINIAVVKHMLLLIAFLCLSYSEGMATHNRAGEITYEHIEGFTYEFTITTYTKTSSFEADRPFLTINFGDGVIDTNVVRIEEEPLPGDIKINRYKVTHAYNAPFTYIVSVSDPNRIENIINISNSVNIPFYLEDTIRIFSPVFLGYNSSPQLLAPPVDFAKVNTPFVHNPNAFDIDGDSLSYKLVPPKQAPGVDVPGYLNPEQVIPGPNNQISIDQRTGEISWDSPQQIGIYNIAILVSEFRSGVNIGTVVRDMQIIVEEGTNTPPIIVDKEDICVIAGDEISFVMEAFDNDVGDEVSLSATGAPLFPSVIGNNFATFTNSGNNNPIQETFEWSTTCDHLRRTDYQVVFKAEDRATNDPQLTDILSLNIKLIAPPPDNLSGSYDRMNNAVRLQWDSIYACTESERFQYFQVFRKLGCDSVILDSCKTGLSDIGYELLGNTENYFFIDENISKGNDYSYRVHAHFSDISISGSELNPFNGRASNEFCQLIPLDIPILYNVDVRSTDVSAGEIYVEWSIPDPDVLDTIVNPGPYKILLERAEGFLGNQFNTLAEFMASNFAELRDTNFLDQNLNTQDLSFRYRVSFYVDNDDSLGSNAASSTFLKISPLDEALQLTWDVDVPWLNDSFEVFRLNDVTGIYESIGFTLGQPFIDRGLVNDSTYCFKIKGIGAYKTRQPTKQPLFNFSQEACGIPQDTVPPCIVELKVTNFCNSSEQGDVPEELSNFLSWEYISECEFPDADEFNIFYAVDRNEDLEIITTVPGNQFVFRHIVEASLAGCYAVTSIDSTGNESDFSNLVCVENCPIYELPNTFTPNEDRQNDLFRPIEPFKFVEKIDLKIYNRWGNLVFETETPSIDWTGQDMSGKELEQATYFYTCEIFFLTSDGLVTSNKPLSGFIQLFR